MQKSFDHLYNEFNISANIVQVEKQNIIDEVNNTATEDIKKDYEYTRA
jgi:hypothetical protein